MVHVDRGMCGYCKIINASHHTAIDYFSVKALPHCVLFLINFCKLLTFLKKSCRGRYFSMLVLGRDSILSSIISKRHGDFQFAFSRVLIVSYAISKDQEDSYTFAFLISTLYKLIVLGVGTCIYLYPDVSETLFFFQ